MTWEIFIKWLPSFIEGAWLTLQLVGVSVVAGLILAVPLVALMSLLRSA